jgi:ABC-type lipoprotein export system ATPase subunit
MDSIFFRSQIATVRNSTLGFIFQSYNLINRTTIQKNVEFPGITGGMSNSDRKRCALKLLKFLGILHKKEFILTQGCVSKCGFYEDIEYAKKLH